MEVLKAAKLVLSKKKMHFTLAGAFDSFEFKSQVQSFIEHNEMDQYINLPGMVLGQEKSILFKSSDIFVFPTYYKRETFAMVNVEAMSYGLPVISSNEGAISEIVKDGRTGFIINPKSPKDIAEKILILANNPSIRNRMGKEGSKLFKMKYCKKAYEKKLGSALDFFLKLLNKEKSNYRNSNLSKSRKLITPG